MTDSGSGDRRAREAAPNVVDLEALRRRYREGREERLRSDATDPYIEIAGDDAHFAHDPWVVDDLQRDAVEEDVEVLIVGGGMSVSGPCTGCTCRASRTAS